VACGSRIIKAVCGCLLTAESLAENCNSIMVFYFGYKETIEFGVCSTNLS